MPADPTLAIRQAELRRRVEALPVEVAQWQSRTTTDLDSNAHFSQLQAIGILMETFSAQQQSLLGQLDPAGQPVTFENAAWDLVKNIIRSQRAWDFFRDKLDLRFSPVFKEILWVADTIAWDCHRPVLDEAVIAGILDSEKLREPPLTYLTADFSPATWIRGSRPNDGRVYDLGESHLPIPVIQLPWDHVENSWEILSLHHEVGHDLEADLRLRAPLKAVLNDALTQAGVPTDRVEIWLSWQGEVFADLVGLQLAGPAFAEALMHLLLLPAPMVTTFDAEDPHPTHYPRILLNAAYIPTMIPGYQPLVDHGAEIAARWVALYGQHPQFDPYAGDFAIVFKALMDTALPELKGKTVRALIPYLQADDLRIRGAVTFMRTGQDTPINLRLRHTVSAARLAVTAAAKEGQLTNDALNDVNTRTMQLVRDLAPPGLRAGGDSGPHRAFIAGFVDKL